MAEEINDFVDFTPIHGGNGIEAAREDEAVEETYIRLIRNTSFVRVMNETDQELFMLSIASEILHSHLQGFCP